MSLAVNPMPIVQMLEPRTKVYNQRSYAILRGGSQSTWKPNISTSYSNSSIQFTAPPPNPKILVDRKVLLNLKFLVTLTGDSGSSGVGLYQAGKSAPRSHPIPRVINVANCTLNNTQVSINLSDVIDPILRYWDPVKKREIDDSMSPCMLDQAQNYNDLSGGVRNPLNSYASSISGADSARGGFNFTVLTNTQTSATILLDCSDYLYIPPFLSDQEDSAAFIQIQTMDFNFTLGNLARVWSADSVLSGITSVTAVLNSAPQLLFNYITPDPLMSIPNSVVYPYYEIQRYPTNVGSVASLASTTVQSANIQLHSIPNKMYVLARQRNADQTVFTSDVFAAITNLSINWNNRNGLCSAATTYDLYKMSIANGLQLSYSQFTKSVGSPICLTFGKDICLESNEAPGMLGTYQLQMSVTFTNPNASSAINYDLYIVTVSEGALTIQDNRAITQIGCFSQNDVINSLNAPFVDYNHLMKMRGASFWGNVKDFFSDVGKGVKHAYDTVSPYVIPAVKTALELKNMAGLGAISGGLCSGSGANAWTDFKSKHAGKGYDNAQLSKMWNEHKASLTKKTKAKAKPKAKAKAKSKVGKRCPVGYNKGCVKKGGIVYEGGDLLDRDQMANLFADMD